MVDTRSAALNGWMLDTRARVDASSQTEMTRRECDAGWSELPDPRSLHHWATLKGKKGAVV
jgi:hypothetical protein